MYIAFSILILVAIVCCYILFRNEKVYKFNIYILNLTSAYCERRILEDNISYEDIDNIYDKYARKYSYDDMLYSLKPLKLEYWFTEEEINELKR